MTNKEHWAIAWEQTRQLNRYHRVQKDLISKEIDLYEVEDLNNHFGLIRDFILSEKGKEYQVFKTTFSIDFTDDKYYFPIREENYKRGKHSVNTIVNDSIFFQHEDRQEALSLIWKCDAEKLIDLGYLKWNEQQLVKFLSKRLIHRDKLTRKHKRIIL